MVFLLQKRKNGSPTDENLPTCSAQGIETLSVLQSRSILGEFKIYSVDYVSIGGLGDYWVKSTGRRTRGQQGAPPAKRRKVNETEIREPIVQNAPLQGKNTFENSRKFTQLIVAALPQHHPPL